MVETQREFFDELTERKKKRSGPFQKSEDDRLSFSFSPDFLLLGVLLFGMCVVIIYAAGVEIGRQAISRFPKRAIPATSLAKKAVSKGPPPRRVPSVAPALPQQPIKRFTIQVASYNEKGVAERELARSRKEGYEASLAPSRKGFALCIGSYETHAQARQALGILQKRYKDCFIRNR